MNGSAGRKDESSETGVDEEKRIGWTCSESVIGTQLSTCLHGRNATDNKLPFSGTSVVDR